MYCPFCNDIRLYFLPEPEQSDIINCLVSDQSNNARGAVCLSLVVGNHYFVIKSFPFALKVVCRRRVKEIRPHLKKD